MLTGSNTYTGGTAINNGGLQIGNGGMAGSIAGDVLNDGTLDRQSSGQPRVCRRDQRLRHARPARRGTLTLTGNNSYTGGTSINSGTLQLGNGGTSGSIIGNVAIGGTLAINQSGSITLGGTPQRKRSSRPGRQRLDDRKRNEQLHRRHDHHRGNRVHRQLPESGIRSLEMNGGTCRSPAIWAQPATRPPATGTEFAPNIQVGSTRRDNRHRFQLVLDYGQGDGRGHDVTKLGSGTWYARYGMGGSGFTGNLNIMAGTLLGRLQQPDRRQYRRHQRHDDRERRRRGHLGRLLGQRRVPWARSPAPATVLEASGYNMSFYPQPRRHSPGSTGSAPTASHRGRQHEHHGARRGEHYLHQHRQRLRRSRPRSPTARSSFPPMSFPTRPVRSAWRHRVQTSSWATRRAAATPACSSILRASSSAAICSCNPAIRASSTIGGTNTSGTVYYTGDITLGSNGGYNHAIERDGFSRGYGRD